MPSFRSSLQVVTPRTNSQIHFLDQSFQNLLAYRKDCICSLTFNFGAFVLYTRNRNVQGSRIKNKVCKKLFNKLKLFPTIVLVERSESQAFLTVPLDFSQPSLETERFLSQPYQHLEFEHNRIIRKLYENMYPLLHRLFRVLRYIVCCGSYSVPSALPVTFRFATFYPGHFVRRHFVTWTLPPTVLCPNY